MAKTLIFLFFIPLALFGGNLHLQKGVIQTHTEVFGDTSIDPSVSTIHTDLNMFDSFESIRGIIAFNIINLKSSNSERDEHMQEMFEMKKFSTISLQIKSITKKEKKYMINGEIFMHGVSKPISIEAAITQKKKTINLAADFSVKVSDYGMEPPSMLFFSVRDRVDINATLSLSSI